MRKALVLVFTGAILLTACRKKEPFDSDSSVSHATADNLFKDLNRIVIAAADDKKLIDGPNATNGSDDVCASITLNPPDLTTFPKTVTIDFGTGCIDQHNVIRKGKLTVSFTDYLHKPGAKVTVSLTNYQVNEVKLKGSYKLNNTSTDTLTRTFTDEITNAEATTPDGKVCTWQATRYSTQTGGFATKTTITDDEYTGGGQSTGVGFNGKSFTATSKDVVLKLNCRYLVSGTSTIYSGTNPTSFVVDFGNGMCDKEYKVSYDTYNTTLEFDY